MTYRRPATFVLLSWTLLLVTAQSVHNIRLHRWRERELLQNADVVVLATVSAVIPQAEQMSISWTGNPNVKTAQLMIVTLNVHHVILGEVTTHTISASFWSARDYTVAASLHRPFVGRTSVHYLTRERDGTYRYVTDIVTSQTDVFSGNRGGFKASRGDAGREIAEILLLPSPRADVVEFTRDLDTSTSRALEFTGFVNTLPLLRSLLSSDDDRVRTAACVTLYDHSFFGQYGCLDSNWIHHASGADRPDKNTEQGGNPLPEVGIRRRLAEISRSRQDFERSFANAFLSKPIAISEEYAALPGKEGVCDFLRLMSVHPSKVLASRATMELRRAENSCDTKIAIRPVPRGARKRD